MAFGRKGGDAPRVVGFDFGPPAPAVPLTPPAPSPAPSPVAEPVAEPVVEPVAQAYPPPAYPPPAYEPPRPAPDALAGYLGPVSTVAPPAPVAAPPDEEPAQRYWRPGAEIPAGWSPDAVAPPRRRTTVPVRSFVSLAVTIVVALGAYRTYHRFFGDPFTRPTAVGEYELITTNLAERLTDELRRDQFARIGRPIAGMYGIDGTPHFVLVAGDGRDDSGRAIYDDVVREAAATRGGRVGPATTVGDITCTTATTDEVAAAVLCFWGSKNGADGVVYHFGNLGMDETARFASLARAAIR